MLTIGMNDYGKIHRSHKWGDYKSTRANSKYTAALHSELSAIIKLGLSDCSHLTIVNIRIDNNNNPAISKPCVNCRKILEQVGYKNLYYFDGKKYIKH